MGLKLLLSNRQQLALAHHLRPNAQTPAATARTFASFVLGPRGPGSKSNCPERMSLV